MGCFHQSDFDNKGLRSVLTNVNMTLEICVDECSALGYKYAGMWIFIHYYMLIHWLMPLFNATRIFLDRVILWLRTANLVMTTILFLVCIDTKPWCHFDLKVIYLIKSRVTSEFSWYLSVHVSILQLFLLPQWLILLWYQSGFIHTIASHVSFATTYRITE